MGDMGDDFRAMREMTNKMRDERLVRFEANVLPKLKARYDVFVFDDGTRVVVDDTPKGTLTIYPKSNKLLVHKENDWKQPAVKWLYKHEII